MGLQTVDHPTMGDHHRRSVADRIGQPSEAVQDSSQQNVVVLPTRRSPIGFQISGVFLVYLFSGQAGELPDVPFDQLGGQDRPVAAPRLGDDLRADASPLKGGRRHRVGWFETGRDLGCLSPPEVRQRGVGLTLPAPGRVPGGLPVTEQQESGHAVHGSGRRFPGRGGCVGLRGPGDSRGAAVASGYEVRGIPIHSELMATLRLFAQVREAAGTGRDEVPGATVDQVLAAAVDRYGAAFAEQLRTCRVWLNGEPVTGAEPVADGDEVAVLPPVSGG